MNCRLASVSRFLHFAVALREVFVSSYFPRFLLFFHQSCIPQCNLVTQRLHINFNFLSEKLCETPRLYSPCQCVRLTSQPGSLTHAVSAKYPVVCNSVFGILSIKRKNNSTAVVYIILANDSKTASCFQKTHCVRRQYV